MDYDQQIDAPMRALAALVRGAVVNDLSDEFLLAVYEDPRTLREISASKLPALAVYVEREKRKRISSADLVCFLTVRFDYVAQHAGPDKRDDRYPSLRKVWTALADAACDGHHDAVQDGADVLLLAGLQSDEDTAEVTYGVTEEGYLFFRGSLVVEWTPEGVDWSSLDDFLSLYASYDNPGDDHTAAAGDELLAVEDAITVPGPP